MAPVTDEKIVDESCGDGWRPATQGRHDLIAKRAWAALKGVRETPPSRDFLPLLVERRVTRELKSGLPVARA